MVRCCLLCKWSTDIDINGRRSLHRFPNDEPQRKKWLKIIGKTNATLSKHLYLCSSHFEDSCFHNNIVGCFKTLKPNCTPTKYLTEKPPDDKEGPPIKKTKFLSLQWDPNESQPSCTIEYIADEDLESPALIQVCRACLAFDVKMCHIGERDLCEYYENITGIELSFDDTLPKMLCWECIANLKKANSFREKALRSFRLLLSKIKTDTYITLRDVQSIDRVENNLQSQLVVEHFNCEDSLLSMDIPESLPEDDIGKVVCQYGENIGEENENIENIPEMILEIQHSDVFEDECQDDGDGRAEQSDGQINTMKSFKSKRTAKPIKWGTLDESKFTIRQLTAAEQREELARRRESAAYRAARYRCNVCYRVFVSRAQQDKHGIKHSDSRGKLECDICRSRLRSSRMLRHHIASCHTTSFACKACPFWTKNSSNAKKHQLFHTGMTYKCPHCPLEFEKQTKYFNHIRLQHVSNFVCEYCGQTFINQRGAFMHKTKSHTPADLEAELAGPYCAECDVRFATDEAHDRHLRQSAAHPRDDSIPSERRRVRSLRGPNRTRRHTSVAVRCEQCGADCENLRAYTNHFRLYHPGCNRTQYSGSDPAMCEHCGRIFQDRGQLKYHMAVHTGGKFECAVCGKSFAHYTTLGYHRRMHQPNGGFACPVCGKRFTSYSNRHRHIKHVHGGEKRYKCDICDKQFGQRSTLQSHIDHVHLNVPWPKRMRAPRPRPALAASSAAQSSDATADTTEI